MSTDVKILICGAETLLGPAIKRRLERTGVGDVTLGALGGDLWLRSPDLVREQFQLLKPHIVFLVAGKSGGIDANIRRPADLIVDNIRIAANVIEAAHDFGVAKLVYVASSCIYPVGAPQLLKPESLWSGMLEATNQSYAVSKLAGVQLCAAFRSQFGDRFVTVIPANMFGPGDKFDDRDAHVIGALIHRIHLAKTKREPRVVVWGSGSPVRDFLYVDDAADACAFVMDRYDGDAPINLGSGKGVTISEIAHAIKAVVGYEGDLDFDRAKPDGMPIKVLDSSHIATLGWTAQTTLEEGLNETYGYYCENMSRT